VCRHGQHLSRRRPPIRVSLESSSGIVSSPGRVGRLRTIRTSDSTSSRSIRTIQGESREDFAIVRRRLNLGETASTALDVGERDRLPVRPPHDPVDELARGGSANAERDQEAGSLAAHQNRVSDRKWIA
jgi:hypothetical protein